jgi:hypothetical protein
MTGEERELRLQEFQQTIINLENKIAILEIELEKYRVKESAIRKAIQEGKLVLNLTGNESGTEIISKVMMKLPLAMSGKFTFLNDLFEQFKDDFNT